MFNPATIKTFKVIRGMPGEWVEVGEIYEVVSFDAAMVWLRGPGGSQTIKKRWFNQEYIEAV